jgi:hypothetical protein
MHRLARVAISVSVTALVAVVVACNGSTSPSTGTGTVATTSIGPIDVVAGAEETVCIYKRLTNTEDIMATSFVGDLAEGSHHLIVYKSTETQEALDPVSCVPFVGLTAQTAIPLFLAGKRHVEYTFPPNVGVVIPAGQMVRIEAHYINATSAQIEGQGNVTIQGLPLAQATGYQAADFGFWGTFDISIPPKATYETPLQYTQGLKGTNVFAMTSHQHRLGTRVQAWQATATPADAGTAPDVVDGGSFAPTPMNIVQGTQVLDEHDWSNPQLVPFDPTLPFDGTNGFAYQCDWSNTTDQAVTFGESALDEMCFLAFYYYPSQGFDLCFGSHCHIHRQ